MMLAGRCCSLGLLVLLVGCLLTTDDSTMCGFVDRRGWGLPLRLRLHTNPGMQAVELAMLLDRQVSLPDDEAITGARSHHTCFHGDLKLCHRHTVLTALVCLRITLRGRGRGLGEAAGYPCRLDWGLRSYSGMSPKP